MYCDLIKCCPICGRSRWFLLVLSPHINHTSVALLDSKIGGLLLPSWLVMIELRRCWRKVIAFHLAVVGKAASSSSQSPAVVLKHEGLGHGPLHQHLPGV